MITPSEYESISNEADEQHEEQKNADFSDVLDSENEDEDN